MNPFVVADIGGTNARFALVTEERINGQPKLQNVKILPGGDFPNFTDALSTYIESLDSIKPSAACIAIASPIEGDAINMTHLPWSFSIKTVQKQFGFEMFEVMNDFNAVAIGTSVALPEDLELIKKGESFPFENRAIIGPGTGLGVSALTYCQQNKKWLPISGLGGHVNLPPVSPFEIEVIKSAMGNMEHVSAEMLISGSGLINLYRAVCKVEGAIATKMTPAELTQSALVGADRMCMRTLETFCSFLGTVAGNVALTFGAKGGVYIAGGIVPRISEYLKNSEFNNRFSSKGVMSEYVNNIPINLIINPHVGLLGAAEFLTVKASSLCSD